MKKLLSLLLCLTLAAQAAWAQGKHEVNAFIGGYYAEYTHSKASLSTSGDLADLYAPHYNYTCGPAFTFTYHYSLLPFLRVGAQATYGYMTGTRWYKLGSRSEEDIRFNSICMLPELKLCVPSGHFRVYGKAAAGMRCDFGNAVDRPGAAFAWDVVPIGAEWAGHKIYGNAELCFGNVIVGGRIGLGFSF